MIFDVAVIGLGYVGMPAYLMLANAGVSVAGVDTSERKLAALRKGKMPLDDEPGFADLLLGAKKKQGRLHFLPRPPVARAYMIAVPTPIHHGRHTADLSYVAAALESIVPVLRKGALVIINSTCPPLTTKDLGIPVLERSGLKAGRDFSLAYCPERLYPGNIVKEIVENDHIIGGIDQRSTQLAKKLYGTFVKGDLIEADSLTAEFCKLVENAFRDVNIAFANELAAIAEKLDVDVLNAIRIANRHPRVQVLTPGIGVGGHCLPIDPWFLVEACPRESQLIASARRINDSRPALIAAKIRKAAQKHRNGKIGLYGLTYKPDVNDLRESPAGEIKETLEADGYKVIAYDPVAGVGRHASIAGLAKDCDLTFILVRHSRLQEELPRLNAGLRKKIIDVSSG